MPNNTIVPVDRRALKTLFDTFWTSSGWRNEESRRTLPADFEYAKRAGLMFDEVQLSHGEIVERSLAAARGVARQAVANAFVVSLASRRLEYRSALGSFAVLKRFPRHAPPPLRKTCRVCGIFGPLAHPEDLNVLNFERYKWGGVRHAAPLYASLDLQLFQKLPHVIPTAADISVLNGVLNAIEAAPEGTSSAVLEKRLATVIKSNKSERDVLVGILGLCGVLATAAHPGYLERFVQWSERELPARRFIDMPYAACWWQRSDGINRNAIAHWFGHLL